ncbi:MAG: oxaloacetate decarboxylase subunit alpha, partial [Firmicutes bacterium]|nr:oxaloacetate decarboxylase subunit alpha [Bacillota bacterium]
LLLPYSAYTLIKRLKAATDLPIVMHTHNTTGTGAMTLLKAVEAGADVIDTALSPLGDGTAQPSTEAQVATYRGTEYDTGIDLEKLIDLAGYFRGVADDLTKAGFRDPARVLATDANTLLYQVPGGMLSNLINQLKQANAMDKYYTVLEEIPLVRKDFGYPPLVTPTSQIVGTQAVMNVLSGEAYKMNPKESQALMRGEYGRLPAPVNEEVRKKVIGDDKVITHRPADDIPPELDKYREEIREYYQQEEDVLSYALFPQVAIKYFQYRQARQLHVDSTMLDKQAQVMPV